MKVFLKGLLFKVRKYHKKVLMFGLLFMLIAVSVLVSGLIKNKTKIQEPEVLSVSVNSAEDQEEKREDVVHIEPVVQAEPKKEKVNIEISDYYITNTGDAGNLYYIDEQKVLWGCGRNEFGQLGQKSQDYEFHEEMVKIAENVIHVDYSRWGFVIFLTEDHKLFGIGNGGMGALQQLVSFSGEVYMNAQYYAVTEPVLLMENISYARCGREDIVAIDTSDNVWTWGVIWYMNDTNYNYQKDPVKILEGAELVTGGAYNHAALLDDGTVWTWGYNYSGNCGIADEPVISIPQKVAEDITMVWTDTMKYNIDCLDINSFGGSYERGMENTIILKRDGSYWICGANVGTEEKVIPVYYEVVDYRMMCTYEFLPYDINK